MKKFFLILCTTFCSLPVAISAVSEEFRYVDAMTFTIINRPQLNTPDFQRLDATRYPDLTKTQVKYYRYSTGLAIVFRTNSQNIRARWITAEKLPSRNNTLIVQRGMDLYIRRDKKWIFAGVATPNNRDNHHEAPIVENMDTTMKECLLYLPLFDELSALEICVDANACFETIPSPFRRKVVVIGSSITHGSSASRPGMAWPARLGRSLGIEFVNMGISGVCKLETVLAQIAADTAADAFVFDAFSNPSAQQIEERLEGFVRRIRESHPATPLIFLQTEVRESGNFDLKKRAFEADKREAARKGMEKLLERDENIYFIDPGMDLGDDHEATVDGVHPTDLGFERMLKKVQPQIIRILQKYGIK